MMTTLGMLIMGLGVSQRAVDATVASQIRQYMSAQATQSDYSRLQSLSTVKACFDERGNPVTTTDAMYVAAYDIRMEAQLPENQSTSRLATVTICILPARGVNASTVDPVNDPAARRLSVLVSDNGN